MPVPLSGMSTVAPSTELVARRSVAVLTPAVVGRNVTVIVQVARGGIVAQPAGTGAGAVNCPAGTGLTRPIEEIVSGAVPVLVTVTLRVAEALTAWLPKLTG